MTIRVKRLLHTRMRVADVAKSVRFYTEVLGLSVIKQHRSPRGSELVFLSVPGSDHDNIVFVTRSAHPFMIERRGGMRKSGRAGCAR